MSAAAKSAKKAPPPPIPPPVAAALNAPDAKGKKKLKRGPLYALANVLTPDSATLLRKILKRVSKVRGLVDDLPDLLKDDEADSAFRLAHRSLRAIELHVQALQYRQEDADDAAARKVPE